ncbi:MAG: hypothetical protein L6V91_10320 [Bacilli bacterium]|nr:MAG: hypothetical protein L6V91_10320 [Bacilli bacterium]
MELLVTLRFNLSISKLLGQFPKQFKLVPISVPIIWAPIFFSSTNAMRPLEKTYSFTSATTFLSLRNFINGFITDELPPPLYLKSII